MARYNVTAVTKEGTGIHHAFDEIHDSLCWSLSALGHDVSKTENWFSESGETNIILGPELIASFSGIPRNSIIVNLEQRSHPLLPNVKRLAKGLPVWDFTKGTEVEWPDTKAVIHLSVGYTPNLLRIPLSVSPDIDLFFAGFMTQRRREFLDVLRKASIKIFAAGANCYGGVRDQILSRTKLALNIHHDGRDQFEIVRCSFLMANFIPVVTEPSSDDIDYEDLATGLTKVPIRVMPDFITSLLASDSDRRHLADAAAEAIQKRDFTKAVAAALDSTSPAEPIRTISLPRPLEFKLEQKAKQTAYLAEGRALADSYPVNVAKAKVYKRYESALATGDMKDFVAWLRARATGNIVEIGVRDGASTSAFLAGVMDTYGHVYSIDTDPKCAKLFEGHPNWTFIHANSRDMATVCSKIPYQFDFLLIDGDHSYEGVKADFRYHQWIRDGGYVALHDIAPEDRPSGCTDPSWPGDDVKRFWEELQVDATNEEWNLFTVPGRYGLGVIQRVGRPELIPTQDVPYTGDTPLPEIIRDISDSDESWEGSKAAQEAQK